MSRDGLRNCKGIGRLELARRHSQVVRAEVWQRFRTFPWWVEKLQVACEFISLGAVAKW